MKRKYQASIFGDFSEIVPSPDVVKILLNLYQDKNLLPSTFQEISPYAKGPETRLKLSTPTTNEWIINFATHRVDVEKNPTDIKGNNIGPVEDFTKQAQELLNITLEEYKKKGNRIALITSEIAEEKPEAKLDKLYLLIYKPIDFYKKNLPFEWNSRFASKQTIDINNTSEPINVITSINRIKGQLTHPTTVLELDRIEINFDINTFHGNKDYRFDKDSIASFYDETTKIRGQLLSELEGLLNV